MERTTALVFTEASCAAHLRTTLLFSLVLVAAPATFAQHLQTAPRPDRGYWMASTYYGASLPTGSTKQTTKDGVVLGLGFGYHLPGRWSFPLNATFSISWLPGPLLNQTQQPNGMNNLFAFTLDPSYDLVRRPRWDVYATGGGGLSTKDVVLLAPDPTCNGNDYIGCYNETGSESSVQPAVDGGIGFSFRVRPFSRIDFYGETRFMDMFTPTGNFAAFGTAGTRFVETTFGIRINEWRGPDRSRMTY